MVSSLKCFSPQDGATPLFIASHKGHLPVVQCLIAAEADVNSPMKVSYLLHTYIIVGIFILNHRGNQETMAMGGGDHEAY